MKNLNNRLDSSGCIPKIILGGLAMILLAAFVGGPTNVDAADELKFVWDPNGIEDFTLTECHGQTITKADLLGKKWIACFIFTRCVGADFCPRVSTEMKELQRVLKDVDVRLVTITVDPARDTPEELLRYSEQFNADPEKWWFLTGDRDVIYRLIRKDFKMIVEEVENPLPGFEVMHSLEIMLVDEQGIVRGRFNARDDVALAKLRRVLKKGQISAADAALIKEGEENERRQSELQRQAEEKRRQEALIEEEAERLEAMPAWVHKIPPLNAALNGLAGLLLIVGFCLIKAGKVQAHRTTMIAAFAVSTLFLISYLVGHFALYHYTGNGSRKFMGVGLILTIYRLILGTHVILAIVVALYLAPVTLYRGLKNQIDRHKTLAKVTFPIWLYVSLTGVIIYFILYHWPVGAGMKGV